MSYSVAARFVTSPEGLTGTPTESWKNMADGTTSTLEVALGVQCDVGVCSEPDAASTCELKHDGNVLALGAAAGRLHLPAARPGVVESISSRLVLVSDKSVRRRTRCSRTDEHA